MLLEEWSDKAPDSFAKTPPNANGFGVSKSKVGWSMRWSC